MLNIYYQLFFIIWKCLHSLADEIQIDEPMAFLSSQKINIDKKGTSLFYYIFLLKSILTF